MHCLKKTAAFLFLQ